MEKVIQSPGLILILLMVWVLPWKGYALWTASRNNNKRWFIAILVLNTFALLDIFYIFYIAKRTPRHFFKTFKVKL